MCEHDNEGVINHFKLDGIERKGLYCKECHELWDYMPQYITDGDVR
jgi:hypothetical protein